MAVETFTQQIERLVKDLNVSNDDVYDALIDYLLQVDVNELGSSAAHQKIKMLLAKRRPDVNERLRRKIGKALSGCYDSNCGPKFSGGCKGCEAAGRQPKSNIKIE